MGEPHDYPLAAVLTVRGKAEEAAKRALAGAAAALAAAEAVEAAARRRLERIAERMTRADAERAHTLEGAALRACDLSGHEVHRARLRGERLAAESELGAARDRARAARAELEAARTALGKAAREREAAERHRDAWQAERERRAEQRREAELDDRGRPPPILRRALRG